MSWEETGSLRTLHSYAATPGLAGQLPGFYVEER